ncbi:hypothetical protein MPUT_0230 [Mycoplasma putrefaciens KS1]|uniref:Uncharacterized protein n=1 Tax=Mycoplasma putrefaciens (strain ATCC 15718 / NCTC 10155 / C30 KS-1 / KS-1) TaxID=743965 RepID=A0A7U4E9G0_MYCPK|nr:hypothetical protein MPUT_0230 [Mycoplasma putrefaciens KS1]
MMFSLIFTLLINKNQKTKIKFEINYYENIIKVKFTIRLTKSINKKAVMVND